LANNTYQENVSLEQVSIITLNDGFKNNYLHTFHILKEYCFDATIFLPADYIYDSVKWIKWDQMRFCLDHFYHQKEIRNLN